MLSANQLTEDSKCNVDNIMSFYLVNVTSLAKTNTVQLLDLDIKRTLHTYGGSYWNVVHE